MLGDASGTALLITAICAGMAVLLGAVGSLVVQLRTARKVTDVHAEVKTLNSLSLANLADATELRRIEAIDPAKRTPVEWEYLRHAELNDPRTRRPPV